MLACNLDILYFYRAKPARENPKGSSLQGGEEAAGGRRSPRGRTRRVRACKAGKKLLEGGEAREGEPEGFELARRGRKLLEGFPRVL